jgi:4'-phosphopantetheinyl transferase
MLAVKARAEARVAGRGAHAALSFHSIDAAEFRDGELDSALELLDADERHRAERLRPALHRARWVVAHAVQRLELAAFLGRNPEAVRYEHSPYGRPMLAAPAGNQHDVDFNISHSGEVLLLGITTSGRIGVDVEAWVSDHTADRSPLWETLSQREAEWVDSHTDTYAAFVRLWTRKEAVVKALGTGLPDDLPALDVLMDPGSTESMLRTPDGASLRVVDLPSPPGFHAAVALTALDVPVHIVANAPAASRFSFLP